MIKPEDITWLVLENTSQCNAWCPGCSRNKNGFGLADNFVVQDLAIERLEQVLTQLPNLKVVQLCGVRGDPVAAKNVLEQLALIKRFANKIQIHTNASLRSTKWWAALARFLSDIEHDIWFCIDGLAGVHEIYRQGTNFEKVIKNAKAFIENGGHASWQFIPFEHNEHQIKDCIRLSQSMGFKHFRFLKDVRITSQYFHWKTGAPIEIKPWSQDIKFNDKYFRHLERKVTVPEKRCHHLTEPSVYLGSNGRLSTCCYFNQSRDFESFPDLPDISQELSTAAHKTCIMHCGIPEETNDTDQRPNS